MQSASEPAVQGCPLCGRTSWETLEQVRHTRVVRCACELVFVSPQPARGVIEEAYDTDYYAPWEEQGGRRDKIWRERIRRVQSFRRPPGTILDVGCGNGDFLRLAQSCGWTVTGTELSPQAVRSLNGLSVLGGELWETGLGDQTFDVVTCWHVIEHAVDPRRMLEEIYRVVRPGGWVLLTTPNLDDHLFRVAYRLARGRWPALYEEDERELHLFFFSARTLSRLVMEAGFQVVELGFDRGAAAVPGKYFVNQLAYGWFRLTGRNWGMGLELVAQRPHAQ